MKISPYKVRETYSSCNPPARPESEDWEYLEGELLTAPDRFMQGLIAGILIGVMSFGLAIVLFSVIP